MRKLAANIDRTDSPHHDIRRMIAGEAGIAVKGATNRVCDLLE